MIPNRRMFSRLHLLLFLFVALLAISSCHDSKNKKNVDVSGIKVDVSISRLEKDLYAVNPDSLTTQLPLLLKKYPDFLPFYLGQMMTFGNIATQQERTYGEFGRFLKDTTVRFLLDTIQKAYPNLDFLESGLAEGFKHYKYYYPAKSIPKIVTFISYFGWSNITYDTTTLGIGLDMYLGNDFKYPEQIPEYMRRTLTKDYIVPNSMKVLASLQYSFEPKDNKLITALIENGKQLYFTDLMLPETEDYLKIGYTKQDIEFCKKSEPEIWKFFIDKDLIYSTDQTENAHYVTPGPNTSGMPAEAPGNIGSWVGWQIVRQYIEKHPETTMDQLMKLDDQQLLNQSKYKPKHSIL